MAKLTAAQIFSDLVGAGFNAAQATVMTAIAFAESGGDDAAVGDVGLENNTWGPSYGLFQVRTLKADTGKGTDRDVNALAGNDAAQAKAAYDISHNGSNFTPWTTYTSGKYQQFLGQAQQTAADFSLTGNKKPGPFATFGPGWLPWNWPSDAGNALAGTVQGSVVSGVRTIVVEGLFVVLGTYLVAMGLGKAFEPQLKKATHVVVKTAETAAKAAV